LVSHLLFAPFAAAAFLAVIVARIRAEIDGLAGQRSDFSPLSMTTGPGSGGTIDLPLSNP
jgi:hypothetical protein